MTTAKASCLGSTVKCDRAYCNWQWSDTKQKQQDNLSRLLDNFHV
jgi:hypothetical protein